MLVWSGPATRFLQIDHPVSSVNHKKTAPFVSDDEWRCDLQESMEEAKRGEYPITR
ncbi:hypothetical protein RvVAT039_19730 [Agrobacterium vitis]|nr:hypothetical protein RvVAT039_19730 [Agrobacterium vitis]